MRYFVVFYSFVSESGTGSGEAYVENDRDEFLSIPRLREYLISDMAKGIPKVNATGITLNNIIELSKEDFESSKST